MNNFLETLLEQYGLKLVQTPDGNIIFQNAWPDRTDFDARLTLFMQAINKQYRKEKQKDA